MPFIESTPLVLVLWAVIGYLLGSIPSGIILARVMGLGNLREIGSGNIGATNVLRTGSKKAAALTLLFDGGKAIVAILLARFFASEDAVQLAALAAFVGHCFPVWLGFKGGKGVATYFGIVLVITPLSGLVACVIWLTSAAIFRYSSLAALLTAGWVPLVMLYLDEGYAFYLGIVLGGLIYIRHWQNIQRLKRGEETKIGAK